MRMESTAPLRLPNRARYGTWEWYVAPSRRNQPAINHLTILLHPPLHLDRAQYSNSSGQNAGIQDVSRAQAAYTQSLDIVIAMRGSRIPHDTRNGRRPNSH
jgi:hypothetical protein